MVRSYGKCCSGFLLVALDTPLRGAWYCGERAAWARLCGVTWADLFCQSRIAASELCGLEDCGVPSPEREKSLSTQGSWNCCAAPCADTAAFLTFKQQFNFSEEKMPLKFPGRKQSKPSKDCRGKASIYVKWEHAVNHWRKPIFSRQL